jgi:hypothetical protein
VSCSLPEVALGARNLRVVFRFVERDGTGVLVPIDLTPAATPPGFLQAFFRKPSREVVMVPLVATTPASGEAHYLTADGFLDEAGLWEAQAAAMLDGAPTLGRGYFPSRLVSFQVLPFLRPFAPADLSVSRPAATTLPLVAPAPVRL